MKSAADVESAFQSLGGADCYGEKWCAYEREVAVMKKVQHPNIIGYFDSFVAAENMHIVMEYADGGTLYGVIRAHLRTGRLTHRRGNVWSFLGAPKYVVNP